MKTLLFTVLVGLCLSANAQLQLPQRIDTSAASIAYWKDWMQNLQTMGARQQKDSFVIEAEVLKLMKDEGYRNSIYPAVYNWTSAVDLLKKMELKKAFWHLINLYADNKNEKERQLVLGTFFMYDSVMEMDKILVSTYYTYAFTDPRVYRVTNNKPQFFRPDLLEKNLALTKKLCEYIWHYRKQKLAKR